MKSLPTLMKEIKDKNISHYNVWHGEETAVLNIYQTQLQERLGYVLVTVETVKQAYTSCNSKGFDKRKKCYVITDDTAYIKDEKLWSKVEERFNNSDNIILIKYTGMDKRSKFYKGTEQLVSFDKLSEAVLSKYIHNVLKDLSDKNTSTLINVCDSSYNLILLEMDKVKQYSNALRLSHDDAFMDLLEDGTIYSPVGDVLFKFVDAVSYGDLNSTHKLLQEVKLKGENELAILSLLYTAFRNMIMVNALGSNKSNAAERTGLTNWQIKKALDNLGGYSTQEMVAALGTIRTAEKGIKTGKVRTEDALDYVVVNIL